MKPPKRTRLQKVELVQPVPISKPYPYLYFFIFFLLPYILYSLWTLKDWGIAYDEAIVYNLALELKSFLLRSVHNPNDEMMWDAWQKGGVFFYSSFESFFFNGDRTLVLEHFHLANFLFAGIIFTCIFALIWNQYRNIYWALGGPLCLVLTPRFFGTIAFNPRDIPFSVFYFSGLTVIFLTRDWVKFHGLRRLILGLTIGMISCVRVVGFNLIIILFLFDFYRTIVLNSSARAPKKDSNFWIKWLFSEMLSLTVIMAAALAFMPILWPYLRVDYFHHLLGILQMGKQFQWNGLTLILGHEYYATYYPWYYLPIWFWVGLPISLLVFFFFSFWLLRHSSKQVGRELYFFFFIAFILNFLMYIVLKPVIYNAERHYLYLMSIIVFMAYLGIVEFFRIPLNRSFKFMIVLLLGLNGFTVIQQMIKLHPYEFIYFNEMAGGVPGAYRKFQLDYWGVSLKEATEWLRDHECQDQSKNFKVMFTGHQLSSMYYFSKNMIPLNSDYSGKDADYFLIFDPNYDQFKPDPKTRAQIIHTVEREGVPLAYVLKLK